MAARQPAWGELYPMPMIVTAQDLLHLPEDCLRNELYEGSIVRTEYRMPRPAALCFRLSAELGIFAKATGLGNIILTNVLIDFTPTSSQKKTVLAPDIAMLRTTAKPKWDDVLDEAPLLAIEVIASSLTLPQFALKAACYRQYGVDEVWLIDTTTRISEIWNAQGIATLSDGQALTSALLPGFSVDITQLLDS